MESPCTRFLRFTSLTCVKEVKNEPITIRNPCSHNLNHPLVESYRAIIENRAKDGWRYVGFIPTKQCGTGHTEEIDLIFEKEI